MDPLLEKKVLKKTLWNPTNTSRFEFYCPLCATPRIVPDKPNPHQLKNYFRIGLVTAFISLCLWPWLSWKGMVSFLPLWMVFEVIFRLKMRVALACPHCGFDPVLCLTDQDKAKILVKEFWDKKKPPLREQPETKTNPDVKLTGKPVEKSVPQASAKA